MPAKHVVSLPGDMLEFRRQIAEANVFASHLPNGVCASPNGWVLWHTRYWGFETLIEELGEDPGGIWAQLSQCYCFARSGRRNEILAVDLRPERFGNVVSFVSSQLTYGGDIPVVAKSFTDWLSRTLDAGPDSEFYWECAGFEDLGPAMEGDPCYECRPRRFSAKSH
ncbi:hypothetical protein AYO49_03705 [Verrucomicrobiaceae bacterium SCGC AG-212-N21]|nr:hypothetical protein AYO49_03705 [Verrucomicrobiaceae bacterium SCGC AG-212-N21]